MTNRAPVVATVAALAYVVTVMQRGSLGVAAVMAADRFETSASQLAALSVVQLALYAGMQIPVGILLDRFGAKKMLLLGAISMTVGQLVLANADALSWALVGRALVGFGDAFTFITMLRLVNSWYTGKRAARIQQLFSNIGQLGQILSSIPFALLLGSVGWTAGFTYLSFASLLVALAVLAFIQDAPVAHGVGRHADVRAVIAGLRASLALPAVRLSFWTHFTAQSAGTVFLLAWGVPYLVNGLGYTHKSASSLLLVFAMVSIGYGPFVGWFCGKYPEFRARLVLFSVASILGSIVTLSFAAPHTSPWVVTALLALIATGGPSSMVAFDISRTSVESKSLGVANGFVNVGGFVASLTMMGLVGLVIDLQQGGECAAGSCGALFSLTHFRIAMLSELLVIGFGALMLVRTRRKVNLGE